MVIFFVTRPHHYTLADVRAAAPPGTIEVVYYGRAFTAKQLPRATYIFADLDRLNPHQIQRAAKLRLLLMRAGCRVLVWLFCVNCTQRG
jgi:hypothetical protein